MRDGFTQRYELNNARNINMNSVITTTKMKKEKNYNYKIP